MEPNYQLIPESQELLNARTYGYYVREQIDAYGTTMPEWLIEDLVKGAAERTDACIDFLTWQVGLADVMSWNHMEIALEAITVRSMDLEMFSQFIQTLVEEPLDGSDESGLQ